MRVRYYRLRAGLSREALAARCGAAGWDIGGGTIAKIEAFRRSVYDAELPVLAKALKVGIMDLYDETIPFRELVACLNKPARS
ncbi:MAG: helix-turn-helix transcriptional regulator [Bdellovibrionaceae bacterium]|nr:helix-turn-helix transcriptional regulator [Pseudobdellovibrionaceae bacterium]